LIVLDVHTVIDTSQGLIEITPRIFQAIGITQILVVVDDAKNIALRRQNDQKRKRPLRSIEALKEQQECSITVAHRAALFLNIPLFILPFNRRKDVTNIIKFFCSQ